MFERKKALKEIEEKLNQLQMYLENNYKDLTLQSYKEAREAYEKYKESGYLRKKDSEYMGRRLAEYEAKLQHYGHANISSFLKERY